MCVCVCVRKASSEQKRRAEPEPDANGSISANSLAIGRAAVKALSCAAVFNPTTKAPGCVVVCAIR